jgi:hypothetical protein
MEMKTTYISHRHLTGDTTSTSHCTMTQTSLKTSIELQFSKTTAKKNHPLLPTPNTPKHSTYDPYPPPPYHHDSPQPKPQTTSSKKSPKSTPWFQEYTPHHGAPDTPLPPPRRQSQGTLKEQRGRRRGRRGRRRGAGGRTATKGFRGGSHRCCHQGRRERSQSRRCWVTARWQREGRRRRSEGGEGFWQEWGEGCWARRPGSARPSRPLSPHPISTLTTSREATIRHHEPELEDPWASPKQGRRRRSC